MKTSKEEIWKVARDHYYELRKLGVVFLKPCTTVTSWLSHINYLQEKILSLQKMFSFQKFQDIDTFIKTYTFRDINKERKVQINYESETIFNLTSQGLFFPVWGDNGSNIKIKSLEICAQQEPDQKWKGLIYGFTEIGNWLCIKTYLETVSVDRRDKIFAAWNGKETLPSFFKKVSLNVKEVTLAEIISDLSTSYWHGVVNPRCEIEDSIQVAKFVWDQLIKYIEKVFQRTQERVDMLEKMLFEIAVKDMVIS